MKRGFWGLSALVVFLGTAHADTEDIGDVGEIIEEFLEEHPWPDPPEADPYDALDELLGDPWEHESQMWEEHFELYPPTPVPNEVIDEPEPMYYDNIDALPEPIDFWDGVDPTDIQELLNEPYELFSDPIYS